jgi:hypothetical protein
MPTRLFLVHVWVARVNTGLVSYTCARSLIYFVLPLSATDEPLDAAEPPLCQVLTANFTEPAKGNDYVEYGLQATFVSGRGLCFALQFGLLGLAEAYAWRAEGGAFRRN